MHLCNSINIKRGMDFWKNLVISWKCQIIQAVIKERKLLDLLLFYIFVSSVKKTNVRISVAENNKGMLFICMT